MTTERKKIYVSIDSSYDREIERLFVSEGTASEISAGLDAIRSLCVNSRGALDEPKLSINMSYDELSIEVDYYRFETDKEYNIRVRHEEAQAKRRAEAKITAVERDRRLYEKLKKKFG